MDTTQVLQTVQTVATRLALQTLGAVIVWVVGRRLIQVAMHMIRRTLDHQKVDTTLVTYLTSSISVILNIVLVIGILGFFGVETTSFAALFAAGGVAIGVAWSGMLANFAAGAFLIVLRPFKVGDMISAGGTIGTVEEIGLFGTAINTPDNIRTIVGNNKLFSDNIQNFSANPYRRVDMAAQLNGSVDHNVAIKLLKERLAKIPNVISNPAPDVEILEFTAFGPVLAVRPYCNNRDYWQVYFDTNRLIREAFGEAGFPAPEHRVFVRPA